MFLTNVNLVKVYLMKNLKDITDGLTFDELKECLKNDMITGVPFDRLSFDLNTLVSQGLVSCASGVYTLSEAGEDAFEKDKTNIFDLANYLSIPKPAKSSNATCIVPTIVTDFVAFKTVPYRYDNLGAPEMQFFTRKVKAHESYKFGSRGLGRSKYSMAVGRDSFDYSNTGILFVNGSVITYIGRIASYKDYDNDEKSMFLSDIIKLSNPISIPDIRDHVRDSFNSSQQKQEFFESEEVEAMKDLIGTKIRHGGCVHIH